MVFPLSLGKIELFSPQILKYCSWEAMEYKTTEPHLIKGILQTEDLYQVPVFNSFLSFFLFFDKLFLNDRKVVGRKSGTQKGLDAY